MEDETRASELDGNYDDGQGKLTLDTIKVHEGNRAGSKENLVERERASKQIRSILTRGKLRLDLKAGSRETQSAPVTPEPTTPTTSNIGSVAYEWDEQQNTSIRKLKGDEENPPDRRESGDDGKARLAVKIRNALKAVDKEVRNLAELSKERNTKREIKETSLKLRSLLSQIMTADVQALLQELGKSPVARKDGEDGGRTKGREEGKSGTWSIESREVATQTDASSPAQGNRDAAIQVGDIEEEVTASEIQAELERCGGEKDFLTVAKKDWPECTFRHSDIRRGDPLAAGEDIVLFARGGRMDTGALARVAERFPELKELGSRETKDHISSISQVTNVRDGQIAIRREKTIYKMSSQSLEGREVMMELVHTLRELVPHLAKDGKKSIAMPAPPELPVEDTRKTLEYALRGSATTVNVYTTAPRKTRATKPAIEDNGAVIIKTGNKSYSEALKEVKEGMREAAGVRLKGIRKTQKGDILLLVKGGETGARKVEEEIRTRTGMQAQTSEKDRRTLLVQGVDGITSREEIEEAVRTQLGQEAAQGFQVSSLRPAVGEGQSATIVATSAIADRLVRHGRVNIGWLECTVKERVSLTRCFKCQEFGHTRATCNGPDRAKTCYKCGKPGHLAKECEVSIEFCYTCQAEGHRNSSTRCPAFLKMVRDARARSKPGRANRAKR